MRVLTTFAFVMMALAAGADPASQPREIIGIPDPPASPAPAGFPMAVVVEYDPWAMIIGADSPRVLLFPDGTLIRAERDKGKTTFSTSRLTADELSSVRTALGDAESFDKPAEEYNLAPGVTDLPTVELVRYEAPLSKRVQVYGMMTGFIRTPGFTRMASPEKADLLPSAFEKAHKVLTNLRPRHSVPWRPQYAEVMIWPYEHSPEEPLPWPKGWPSLDSKFAIRMGEESYSILLAGGEIQKLEQLLANLREKQAIAIGGKKWSVAWRPVTPGSPMAHEAELKYRADSR